MRYKFEPTKHMHPPPVPPQADRCRLDTFGVDGYAREDPGLSGLAVQRSAKLQARSGPVRSELLKPWKGPGLLHPKVGCAHAERLKPRVGRDLGTCPAWEDKCGS